MDGRGEKPRPEGAQYEAGKVITLRNKVYIRSVACFGEARTGFVGQQVQPYQRVKVLDADVHVPVTAINDDDNYIFCDDDKDKPWPWHSLLL